MKNFKHLLLVFLLIPCIFILNGCSFWGIENVYVTNIVQTGIVGNTTTYTVYYSNGSTSLFTVNNGKDGKNGNDLTIESIKEYCNENQIDFDDFLAKYLTIVHKSDSVQDATNKAIQSAVTIWCEFPVKDYYLNKSTSLACGAGVIYKMEDGNEYSYILTNYHVVFYTKCVTINNIAKKIKVYQYGGNESVYNSGQTDNGYPTYTYGYGAIDAEFVGGSLNYDLAILRVKTSELLKYNPHSSAVTLAEEYQLGESAIAIGNPECEGFSVTNGIISVVSEDIEMKGADDVTECKFRVMRIDTAVNGGNSGGGLFNMNGELIGIVNAKAVSSDIDNIAYAIPVDNAEKVAENLIYYYEKNGVSSKVKKLELSFKHTVENSHSVYNPITNRTTIVDDLKVTTVDILGFGHLIGLQEGDIIKSISINGTNYNISRSFQFEDLLLTIRAGDKIMLTVKRGQITKELGLVTDVGILSSQLSTID